MPRYASKAAALYAIYRIRYNFLPIFYENGKIHNDLKIAKINGTTVKALWADEDEEKHITLYYMGASKSPVIRFNLAELGFDTVPLSTLSMITVEPIDGGVILRFGARADPGPDPAISPVYIKRLAFRVPRAIPRDPPRKLSFKFYLDHHMIREVARHYNALVHAGGSTFMLVRDPMPTRRPFFEIVKKNYENGLHVYANVQIPVLSLIGLGGKIFTCYDFIRDIGGRTYLRLVDEEECRGDEP